MGVLSVLIIATITAYHEVLKGCHSTQIDDAVLYQAFVSVFNVLVENKDYFIGKWQEVLGSDNLLQRYRANKFIEIITDAKPITEFDVDRYFMLVEKNNGL